MLSVNRTDWVRLGVLIFAAASARISSAQIRFVELKATSMVYCPQDNRIYATGASDAKGVFANSVCRINPSSGKIEASVFVGSDPKGIVRSPDGKSLYVIVADNKMIRQIDRASMEAGVNFPVGEDFAARRVVCVPELPDAVIVHRYHPGYDPQGDNLCVFVKGQTKMEGAPCGKNFALGIDPARVITSSDDNCSNFYFGINALLHTDEGPSLSNGRNMPLISNGFGLVIASQGYIIDPESHQNLGRVPIECDEVCVDPIRPAVYEIYDDQHPSVCCFDLQTFRELWKADLPTWEGHHHPCCPIRYGVSGFAYLDEGYVVCGPWTLGKASPSVDLSVDRSGFPKGNPEGKSFTYTLTVKNNSDSPSNGTFLTDTIPGVTEIKSVVASQGTAIFAQGAIRADLGSIPARSEATVKVSIRVINRGSGGFCAVVRSFDPDPDTTNNVYPGISFVPHTKLEMGTPSSSSGESTGLSATWKALERQAKGAGENLTIEIDGSITIKNDGTQSTHPMVVRFYLQDGPNLVVDWAVLVQEVRVPSIGPGQSCTVDLQAPFDSNVDIVGEYVIAQIDPLKVNGPSSKVGKQIQ